MEVPKEVQNHSIIDLASWFEQPAGRYIRHWEQAKFDELTADIFGFNALQIGQTHLHALAANRMPNKWLSNTALVSPSIQLSHPGHQNSAPVMIVHDFAELPFASQSIDLVVLPHILEFCAEPHQVLREVERILIPEGKLIICGFNRNSLWGARQLTGRMTGHQFLPKEGEFISATRMKDWLKLLNLEVKQAEYGCYLAPYKSDQWLQRFTTLEKIGKRCWPSLGAVYVLQAIKRVRGMHLIGPAFKAKKISPHNAIPVANKISKKQ